MYVNCNNEVDFYKAVDGILSPYVPAILNQHFVCCLFLSLT